LNILLVDDESAVLSLETTMIKKLGYNAFPFSNAIEALEYFKNNSNIDLVISDSTMRNMSGEQLAKEIKSIKDIPFIICSGYDKNEEELKKLNINFILKPFSFYKFSMLIKKVLEIAN